MYDKIKKFYILKLWTAEMVKNALLKGVITEAEYEDILKTA